VNDTEWLYMCSSVIKKLLTHSLTRSLTHSSNIQNDGLVLADPGCPGKWPLNGCCCQFAYVAY